jgi:dephospho-CoA kinase
MTAYVVGLTGGVASGKSEVARRFEALRVTVVDADVAAREAVAPGSEGLIAIVAAFGTGALAADGSLDRMAMRRRVFADDDARRTLEGILHPRVRVALREACLGAAGPYAIAAIPLLAEGGGRAAYPWLDRILVVDVARERQLERLLRRDGIDQDLAEGMLAAQASREARLAIADDILVNDAGLDALDRHVAALHAQYLALASPGRS